MKTCSICKETKSLSDFYTDASKAGHRYMCKVCDRRRIAAIQLRRKEQFIGYWEETRQHSGCLTCSYRRFLGALEFHHRDPIQKLFALTTGMKSRPWDEITTEIDKCDLLCANCHRELHVSA